MMYTLVCLQELKQRMSWCRPLFTSQSSWPPILNIMSDIKSTSIAQVTQFD